MNGTRVMQANEAFEVNGNEIADEADAIRYARAIAEQSGKSVMVW